MANILNQLDMSFSTVHLPDPHHISHRRKIGAFYTPLSVTKLLCQWGIRTKTDRILEPCFGGCTFLEASVTKLEALGQKSPQTNIYGCDIDPLAFKYLETRLGAGTISTHFFQNDFLKIDPDLNNCGNIDFVVGNPPYIRHDNFSEDQKNALNDWKEKKNFRLNGRSSLWAYFLIHSLRFLKEGGRVALVLPGSFLTAQYAKDVRVIIEKSFERVSAITLTERLFVSEGTEELTIILLAEGYKTSNAGTTTTLHCLENIKELKDFLLKWESNEEPSKNDSSSQIGTGMVPNSAVTVLNELSKDRSVKKFGDIASIRIGVVTGNKKFFIKSAAEWKTHGIDRRHLQYISPRSLWIQGISINHNDAVFHENTNVPCLALKTPSSPREKNLLSYLETYPKSEIQKNSTFSRREIWHQFLDSETPDAIMVFMTDFGPRLVINEINVNCTNSLYRVNFKGLTQSEMKLVAISFHSTLTQLSAELLGHGRGSGALKLEPSDAAKLEIYLPERTKESINEAFNEVDRLMRNNKSIEAASYADNYIFQDSIQFRQSLPILKAGLVKGRMRRMREKMKAKNE